MNKDQEVVHYGTFEGNPFVINEQVKLEIDEKRRRMNAKLHSAGHLLGI